MAGQFRLVVSLQFDQAFIQRALVVAQEFVDFVDLFNRREPASFCVRAKCFHLDGGNTALVRDFRNPVLELVAVSVRRRAESSQGDLVLQFDGKKRAF